MFKNPKDSIRKEILEKAENIAIVGLSSKPERPSNMIGIALQENGYRIIPVNPNETKVLGELSFSTLSEVNEPVDIVNIFMRSEKVLPVVKEAVDLGMKVIWMQQGVYNEEAANYALDKGVTVIMDRCIKVDHALFRIDKSK